MTDLPLYLFAKAPVAGKVKTRLQPHISESQSAQVATALLRHATFMVEQFWPGQSILNVAPDLSHPVFSKLLKNACWQTSIQPQLNLGGRMQSALTTGINTNGAASVLGTDIPAVNQAILETAYELLKSGNNVVGACEDGGFYLLGLHEMPEQLFNNITWSTENVFARLMANADKLGIQFKQLPVLADCDNYADLQAAVVAVPEFKTELRRANFDVDSLGG